jgi:uncharacterized membrane protein YhhN
MSLQIASLAPWLAAGSAAAALVYGVFLVRRPPSPLKTGVKVAAVGLLTVLAYIIDAPLPLVIALLFSTIGDGFLAGASERWLPLGLGAFLLAHLAYIRLFSGIAGGVGALMAEQWRAVGVAAAILGGLGIIAWLWNGLGKLRLAVLVYAGALASMTAIAFTLPKLFWPAIVGGAAFFVSDALLSGELFKNRRGPWTAQAVWWLYYGAQAAIAWAFLR